MTEKTSIVEGSHIQEFFMQEIKKASVHIGIRLSDLIEFYIVSLLTNFEKTESLFIHREDHFEEEPLALMLARAIDGDIATQIKELKKIGDTALYTTGFFSEHIVNKAVKLSYYVDMGSNAYSLLSEKFAGNKTFEELYNDLASQFVDIAHIIGEISIPENVASNIDLLKLYELYLRSGDEKLRTILLKEGIITTEEKLIH